MRQQRAPVLDRRRAGVLLHPTSLPDDGHGVLGASARAFVDFLAEAGFSVWQVLPLGPTHADGSPYQTQSAHAGESSLLDRRVLLERGWIDSLEASRGAAHPWHAARLGFEANASEAAREARARFEHDAAAWLDDYALFAALRVAHAGAPWWEWPRPLREREPDALQAATVALAERIADERFAQYLFDCQWRELREYAGSRGVRLFGDLPIFVAWDSADCWAERGQFLLDDEGRPEVVAGVPPDYFSATGQRWGNPLYDWQRMARDDYRWWRRRLASQLRLFDVLRVDHFRGFAAYWEIPASEHSAVNGRWASGPGAALFERLTAEFGALPLVAEDLGLITEDVIALREVLGLPGMKVLQFAFGGDAGNPYLPHNHEPNSVVYTGTHDNDTTLAWANGVDDETRRHAARYLRCAVADVATALASAALASVSRWAMLPMQDVLHLGEGHRMNVPGTVQGNWRWRFRWSQIEPGTVAAWHEDNRLYGRC